jgi:hypothetical protein
MRMDLPEDVYVEIGRIAVNAAGLEERIVMLLVMMSDSQGEADELLQKPSMLVRERLRAAAEAHPDVELGSDVVEWLDEAQELLNMRNSLIHAEWIELIGVQGGTRPAALHSKSGSMIPAEFIPGLHLPERLRTAWEAGRPLGDRAAIHAGWLKPGPDVPLHP